MTSIMIMIMVTYCDQGDERLPMLFLIKDGVIIFSDAIGHHHQNGSSSMHLQRHYFQKKEI